MYRNEQEVQNKKIRVDETRSIDILDLQRKNVFSKGSTWSWTSLWSQNGEVVTSNQVEMDENKPVGLRFIYTITNNDSGKKNEYDYIIPIESTNCNYGGKRWWFTCPLVVNGRPCQRRCRIVYLPPEAEYFGCRECHQLTYESRQRHRDKFYEGFEKPLKTMGTALEELAKTNSFEKKEKLWQKLSRARTIIEGFNNILTKRNRI